MIKEILQLDDSETTLRATCRELTQQDILSEEIQHLITEMKETMRAAPGVGLAAPQIGVNIKLAVIEDPEERLKLLPADVLKDRGRVPVNFHVIINPAIIKKHGKTKHFFEGCLSVQGKVRVTPRHECVTVACLDEHGREKIIEASGWYARILQHEIDHLNGALYIDVADEKTEMLVDEVYKNTWMNASSEQIASLCK
ncbi:MAG TPA: peptide deformylase [Gammaproteobacteria bacterium]|nr:peptide deformylase [Gammaproteobacteria bacterium]